MGILEIKRSAYTGIGEKMESLFSREDELTTTISIAQETHKSLGVICVKENNKIDSTLSDLISKGRVVVISELCEDGTLHIKSDQIMILVNFLVSLRLRAKLTDGKVKINTKELLRP